PRAHGHALGLVEEAAAMPRLATWAADYSRTLGEYQSAVPLSRTVRGDRAIGHDGGRERRTGDDEDYRRGVSRLFGAAWHHFTVASFPVGGHCDLWHRDVGLRLTHDASPARREGHSARRGLGRTDCTRCDVTAN